MTEFHRERLRTAFTAQAATFEDDRLNVAFTSGLQWLLGFVDARSTDRVLDVAAGTGLVARALAPQAGQVVAVDVTEAMVAEGRTHVPASGPGGVAFVLGDAEALPFAGGLFDLVVTRFSLHHFPAPDEPLAEMVRVLRPGGRLVVKDLVASTDPPLAERQDHIERLRDASHVRMPPRESIAGLLETSGLAVLDRAERSIDRPVEAWLEQSVTPEPARVQVRTAFEAESSGGEPTGFEPRRVGGELWFHQTWEITVGRKA